MNNELGVGGFGMGRRLKFLPVGREKSGYQGSESCYTVGLIGSAGY